MIGSLAVENLLGLSLKNLASLSTWGGGGGGGGGGSEERRVGKECRL